MPSYEVIVVGLGAVGSAAIRHLARLGTKVLGIDRYKPPHGFGSSAGETRLTRAAVGEGWNTPRWHCARTRFGGRSKPRQAKLSSSSVDVSRSPGTQTSRWSTVSTSSSITCRHPPNDITIPHEIFRSADALRSRFPQFAVSGTEVGFLDKGGGYLFVEACIRTQLRSAEDCGVELKFGEKVVTFNSSASGVTVTTESGERYDAEKLSPGGRSVDAGFSAGGA
jgi:sarcosine oxidase